MRNEKTNEIEGEKMNTNGGGHHVTDEDDSETSFSGEQTGLLDRLGIKIDDGLHRIFTAYEIGFYLIEKFICFFVV
jgi:hypothetical protein